MNIEINNEGIEQVDSIKFLTLLVDSNLDWNKHVNSLLPKINSGLYALKRMSLCAQTHLLLIHS